MSALRQLPSPQITFGRTMFAKDPPTSWRLAQKAGDPCQNANRETSGFYEFLTGLQLDRSVRSRLPRTCDRFDEALFFLQLMMSLKVCEANRTAVNYCFGAHLVAYIAMNDVAEKDFGKLGIKYRHTTLHKEFVDPIDDPVLISRLYRDLRNLATHHARLVEIQKIGQLQDVLRKRVAPRWYLTDLKKLDFDSLRSRRVKETEIPEIAEHYERTPLIKILCNHLAFVALTIRKTVKRSD